MKKHFFHNFFNMKNKKNIKLKAKLKPANKNININKRCFSTFQLKKKYWAHYSTMYHRNRKKITIKSNFESYIYLLNFQSKDTMLETNNLLLH